VEELGGVDEVDPVRPQHVGDGADQCVGGLGAQPHEHLQQRPVGSDAGEDLRVLDLARHHGLAAARRLQQRDALAELPERDPVQCRAPVTGERFEVGARLFLHGHHRDGPAQRPRGVEHQQREAAVAGDESEGRRGRDVSHRPTHLPGGGWPAGG
jgi:hypothetical protein